MTSRSSFLTLAASDSILSATDQWKVLWDSVAIQDKNGPQHTGFARHALEFWWLSRTLMKVAKMGDACCRYMQSMPTDSVNDLHDFIRKYKDM